jgi:hypothetical protein
MSQRKKSEKRQRNKFISIRATDEEKQHFLDLAKKSGLTPADYFRKSALKSKPLKPTHDRTLLIKLLANWGRLGNNLNQIAKHYNSGNPTDQAIGQEIISKVENIRRDLRKALGHDL